MVRGLETTLAQIAYDRLGINPNKVKLVHGDTAYTALFHRDLGLALYSHGRRCGGGGLRLAG